MDIEPAYLPFVFFFAAVLYSSVGHAGASGYLAAMSLAGMAPEQMKPAALCMNIVVATLTTYRFHKAGYFSFSLLWPFAVAAAPLAYIGGLIPATTPLFKPIVGLVLCVAAVRLFMADRGRTRSVGPPSPTARVGKPVPQHRLETGATGSVGPPWPTAAGKMPTPPTAEGGYATPDGGCATLLPRLPKTPPLVVALGLGGVIGFLSGLTGTGGGIFLSPILILAGWADPRVAGGVSAAFILLNSIAGLGGVAVAGASSAPVVNVPADLPLWVAVVFIGALAGSELGTRQLAPLWLKRLLGVVLLIAGFKFLYPVLTGSA